MGIPSENILTTREPGGSGVAEVIRNILVHEDRDVEAIDPAAQMLLFLAARLQHLKSTIIPALEAGKIVISDRYIDSTRVFQGLLNKRAVLLFDLLSIPELKIMELRPDHTLFFDVSRENSEARSKNRGLNGLDKIHQQRTTDVTQLWREHFQAESRDYSSERIHRIDANKEPAEVSAQIRSTLVKILVAEHALNKTPNSAFISRYMTHRVN